MDWMQLWWKILVARGLVGIVFGITAVLWPVATAIVLVVLWGVWALVDGLGSLVEAANAPVPAAKVLFAVVGVVAVVCALLAFTRPGVTATALTWLLGIWLLARGAVEVATMLLGRRVGPLLLGLLSAGLSVMAGLLFVLNPGGSAIAIAFWLGAVALLWGVVSVIRGVLMRGELGSATLPQSSSPA